jgi:hypothetical protein
MQILTRRLFLYSRLIKIRNIHITQGTFPYTNIYPNHILQLYIYRLSQRSSEVQYLTRL